jgi:hypothetical protein
MYTNKTPHSANTIGYFLKTIGLILLIVSAATAAQGQSLLDKTVSVEFNGQPLGKALEILGNKGKFYFSYNSAILKKDSLIDCSVQDKTIREILDMLFRGSIEYEESGNYIILHRAPMRSPPVTRAPGSERKMYISGVILDGRTGEKVGWASVYDKQALIATLSNEQGDFILRIRTGKGSAALTVSKEFYEDTTVVIPLDDRQITISISPAEMTASRIAESTEGLLRPDPGKPGTSQDPGLTRINYNKKDPIQIEMTPLARLFLSYRLRIQSINLPKFIVNRPFQISFLPGLSSHGYLASQVVNNLSLNAVGGYTGGLKGVELGGVFNIDKKNVQGVQAAGLMNIVGGSARGLQMAGVHNTILDTLTGWQLAGVSNFAGKEVRGIQAAGVVNIDRGEMRGTQISGVFNYARKLSGVQIGLVNIADTSDGYSIGLINIVPHGYHEFGIFADENSPFNFAFRSGNPKLYSILLAGFSPDATNRFYYYGLGLGHRFPFSRKLFLNSELYSEQLAPGNNLSIDHASSLSKLSMDLHWQLNKWLSVSAGPSLAIYYSDRSYIVNGQVFKLPGERYSGFASGDTRGWIGWHAGINFF